MKKTLSLLLLPLVALTLASCDDLGFLKNSTPSSDIPTEVASGGKTLALEMATGLSLIQPSQSGVKGQKMTDDEVAKIKGLLPTIDAIMEGGGSFETTIAESDNADYAIKQVITLALADSVSREFTLYYNVTSELFEVEDEEDEKEEKTTTKYGGIALYLDETYTFSGQSEYEVETEEGETEESSELKIKIETGANSYISVEQEIEKEDGFIEEEYNYKVVTNGSVTNAFTYEIDPEDNEKEVKILIDSVIYKFEATSKNGQNLIEVKIKDDDSSVVTFIKSVVTQEDGSTVVTYELLA